MAESEAEFQKMLDCVDSWCKKWRLKVNINKTNILHFRNKRKSKTSFNFKFDGVTLDIVNQYKYLGTVFSEHLDFEITSSILAGAAGRALGAIISKFKTLKNVGYKTFNKMYHSQVVPIMEYGSGIWGYGNSLLSNKIQFRAIRYFLGVHPKTPLLALEGDMGWKSCRLRQHVNMIRFWNRMINMDENRLTKRIFNWDYNLCKNWCLEIKQILYSASLEHIYNEQNVCNINTIDNILTDLRNNQWKESLPSKPKLRTYMKFKDNVYTEDYVKYCKNRRRRSLLAQFRLGILPLHIETGRFRKKQPEERICPICNTGIEDEYHFVCICEEYSHFREMLYNKVVNVEFNVMSNEEKFVYLINNCWKELSIYIEKAWDKRNGSLYK